MFSISLLWIKSLFVIDISYSILRICSAQYL